MLKVTHRQLRNDGLNHLTIPGIRLPAYVKTWCEENGMVDGMSVVNQYGNAIRDYIANKLPYSRLREIMGSKVVVYDNEPRFFPD